MSSKGKTTPERKRWCREKMKGGSITMGTWKLHSNWAEHKDQRKSREKKVQLVPSGYSRKSTGRERGVRGGGERRNKKKGKNSQSARWRLRNRKNPDLDYQAP